MGKGLKRELKDGRFFDRLAESSPISLPAINPLFYTPHPENMNDYFITDEPQWQPNDYGVEEHRINLLKMKMDPIFIKKSTLTNQLRDNFIKELFKRIEKLKEASIPVFVDSSKFGLERYPNSLMYEYSVPEQFEYQQFFVMHDFDRAVKEAAEHARNKVWELIDKM
tara:strand:+ start:28870 stop:29370 length:501 start_codon:yes stop_codon:yes gene_type:complete